MIDYQWYITQSKEWAHKRLVRIKVDGFKCRTCWSTEDLEVHHLTYERLGNEDITDLITLCTHCHEAITSSIRERRYQGRNIQFANVEENSNLQYVENSKVEIDFGKELRKELNYVENANNKIDFGSTPNPAQWQFSRPYEPNSEGDEESLFKTEENRCRLYRNESP